MFPKSANKIMCPLDLSNYSLHIADYAKYISGFIPGSKIYMIHVIADPTDSIYCVDSNKMSKEEIFEGAKKNAYDILYKMSEEVKISQNQVIHVVQIGDPKIRLLEFVEKEKIDLIVMSTHGRTGLSKILVGSVAEQIIRKVKIPIVVFNKYAAMVTKEA